MKNFKILGLNAVSVAMVGTVVVLGAVALSKLGKPSTCATSNQNVVGQVVSVSSGNLFLKDEQSGKLCALRASDTLRLGDTVMAGPGVKAALKLTAPPGTSEDSDLVLIRPLPGKEYPVNVKLERQNDGSIETTISSESK
ncbi:hypothetical protein HY250_02845 [Candidatus Azambacteria bacterium]|nr:hypothetical protein [Candidatus Azambacteria bacterium]